MPSFPRTGLRATVRKDAPADAKDWDGKADKLKRSTLIPTRRTHRWPSCRCAAAAAPRRLKIR
jgi:hypothetical protein